MVPIYKGLFNLLYLSIYLKDYLILDKSFYKIFRCVTLVKSHSRFHTMAVTFWRFFV